MTRVVLVTGKFLSLGLQALLFAMLARRFDDPAFGSWLASFTLAQILGGLADFGLTTTAQRLVVDKGRSNVLHAFRLWSTGSIVVGTLAFFIAGAAGMRITALLAAFPVFAFARLQTPRLIVAAAEGLAVRIAVSETLNRAIPVAIVAISPRDDVMFWLGASMAVAGLASYATLAPSAEKRSGPPPDRTAVSGAQMLLRNGRSFGVLAIASTVHGRNDQMFLSRYGFESALPAYNAAYRLFDSIIGLSSASLMTFFNDLHANADKKRWTSRTLMIFATLGICVATAVWIAASWTTNVLLGSSNLDAVFCARVLGVGAGAGIVNAVVVRLGLSRGLDHSMLYTGVALMVANLATNAIVLRSGGVRAAAITTTLFEFLGLVAMSALVLVNRNRPETGGNRVTQVGSKVVIAS